MTEPDTQTYCTLQKKQISLQKMEADLLFCLDSSGFIIQNGMPSFQLSSIPYSSSNSRLTTIKVGVRQKGEFRIDGGNDFLGIFVGQIDFLFPDSFARVLLFRRKVLRACADRIDRIFRRFDYFRQYNFMFPFLFEVIGIDGGVARFWK